jgi:prepilin peptidase CpaA
VGLGWALASAALGFSIWFPFYLFRMLGAGDVKLFAAASTWLAPSLVLESALATALVGGALALFWFFRSQGAKLATVRLLHATRQPGILREALPVTSRHQRVPYGVAMTLGLLVTVWRFDAWLH